MTAPMSYIGLPPPPEKKGPYAYECRVSEITFSALTESINFTPLIQGLASSSKRHAN